MFVVVAWSRFGWGRSQRRSVEEHQRALDVLGEVAKRRDGIAPVHTPSPQEIGRAHVHQTENAVPRFRGTDPGAGAPAHSPVRLVLGSGSTPVKLPIFDDASARAQAERLQGDRIDGATAPSVPALTESGAVGSRHLVRFDALGAAGASEISPLPPASDDDALLGIEAPSAHEGEDIGGTRSLEGSRSSRLLGPPKALRAASGGNPFFVRRVASVAAIIIVLAAVGVGSWQLSSGKSPPRAAAPPQSTPHGSHKASSSHHGSHAHQGSSPSVVHEISPTSTSPSIVTFPLSASSFTITFSATAPCWIGILPSQHGAYLWMTTLEAGTTTTYHASAPVYVRIGAPQWVIVKVDGVRLALPPKMIQPYDVTFTVGSSISA